MAWAVFLRGVNVGGHKAFRPSLVAEALADLDVANIGAAGTFVVRKAVGEAALRARLSRALPFAADVMICRGEAVAALHSADPFARTRADGDATRYLSVLARRPRSLPPLPLTHPGGANWQVKVVDVRGRFALSLHRRVGRTFVYPNEVVEKRLAVPATTRNWNTVGAICEALDILGLGA
jgi:uncharacterized protein (DUF1697 family)